MGIPFRYVWSMTTDYYGLMCVARRSLTHGIFYARKRTDRC